MEQRKRPGGKGGLGYYTSWEKKQQNGCIYCGRTATTREHIPSRVFLRKPYPENLSIIPACEACNNGYSEDEKYVAYFLELLKSWVYLDYTQDEQIDRRLLEDKKLQKILQEQIWMEHGKVYFRPDKQRLSRIILKLARGHAGFELDYVNFDDEGTEIWYDFVFNLSRTDMEKFEEEPQYSSCPEVGSRGMCIIQDLVSGDAYSLARWYNVQNGRYRYQVLYDSNDRVVVKIVFFEFLFCKVTFI